MLTADIFPAPASFSPKTCFRRSAGSMVISKTFLPSVARDVALEEAKVVFPTPPVPQKFLGGNYFVSC